MTSARVACTESRIAPANTMNFFKLSTSWFLTLAGLIIISLPMLPCFLACLTTVLACAARMVQLNCDVPSSELKYLASNGHLFTWEKVPEQAISYAHLCEARVRCILAPKIVGYDTV